MSNILDQIRELLKTRKREDEPTELLSLKGKPFSKKPLTGKEVSDIINDKEHSHTQESVMSFKDKLNHFKDLAETSPLTGRVAGFNRHVRDMSPATREIVLKSKMPELLAFANDRQIDLGTISDIANATISSGRIPDLDDYGIKGDNLLAIKDFMKDFILNLAEQLKSFNNLSEEKVTKARHLKLASDYHNLANFHKRKAKEEADNAADARKEGKPHSANKHNAEAEKHKILQTNCAGLADYHQLQANDMPEEDDLKQPKPDLKMKPPEPQKGMATQSAVVEKPESRYEGLDSAIGQFTGSAAGKLIGGALGGPAGAAIGGKLGSEAGKQAGVSGIVKQAANALTGKVELPKTDSQIKKEMEEATIAANFGHVIRPSAVKMCDPDSNMTFSKPKSMLPSDLKDNKKSGNNLPTDQKKVKGDEENPPALESMSPLERHLHESKKRKTAPVSKEKSREVLANIKLAKHYADLGHKMDSAESKLAKKKPTDKWSKLLKQTCLKSGGSAASDEVLKAALSNTWVRDQGFTDESSNLRRKWETSMSDASNQSVDKTVMSPNATVFTLNRMINLSKGFRGN